MRKKKDEKIFLKSDEKRIKTYNWEIKTIIMMEKI